MIFKDKSGMISQFVDAGLVQTGCFGSLAGVDLKFAETVAFECLVQRLMEQRGVQFQARIQQNE